MLPIKSNTADQGCSPVSSNCVIWQGPDLSCINLCKGDTVSDVIYKLAVELCAIQGDAGLSDLDLTCLVNVCQATPEPEKTLAAVLDLLINKVCCLADIINDLPDPGTPYVEPTLNLPACLQYQNNLSQTVSQLQTSDYLLVVATKLCEINSTVASHTTAITNLDNRVTILENADPVTIPQVTPTCVLPATPTDMDEVLTALEQQYCQLKALLGTNAALTSAIASQCQGLSSAQAFSQAGTMSGLIGWNNTVTTLAQSMQNMWLTLCDLRTAVTQISDCCTSIDCAAFILDFTAGASNDRTAVTVYFPDTVIPAGAENCTIQGSKITISDTSGHNYVDYIDLIAAVSDVDGITFDLSATLLNPNQTYTVVVEGCVKKGSTFCNKTVTQTISVPCPIVTGVTTSLT